MLHGLGALTDIENGIPRPRIIMNVIHIKKPQGRFDPSYLFFSYFIILYQTKIMEHQITVGRMWKPAVLGKPWE
jgi:hypothetical protein